MLEPGVCFHTGVVVYINPKTATCDIMRTHGGMLYNVGVANSIGGMFSTDMSWFGNLRGSVVFFGYIEGIPYIFGTLPGRSEPAKKIVQDIPATATGSENDKTYGKTESPSFASGRNTDHQPGDKVISSDGGASLSLLGDGGAILKVSPLCQLIFGAGMDFARLVARQFQIFTDFGSLEFSHGSSGRNCLTIKGGAVYSGESKAGEGIHTVFMHLGDTPDAPEARLGMRVTSTDGKEFGALMMGKDGKLIFCTSNNYLLTVGRDKNCKVKGHTYDQFEGGYKCAINENKEVSVGGYVSRIVLQYVKWALYDIFETVVKGNETHIAESDMYIKVGKNLNLDFGTMTMTGTGAGDVNLKCKSLNITRA